MIDNLGLESNTLFADDTNILIAKGKSKQEVNIEANMM